VTSYSFSIIYYHGAAVITLCITQLPGNKTASDIITLCTMKKTVWLLSNQTRDGETEEENWTDKRILYYRR